MDQPHSTFPNDATLPALPYFVADPRTYATTFDLVGGTGIQAIKSQGGLQMSCPNGNRFQLDLVNTLGGNPCIALGHAANQRLTSITGGATGNAPHSLIALVRNRTTPDTLRSFLMLGQFSQGNSTLGTVNINQFWGGGNGFGVPMADIPTEPSGEPAVVCKTYDGTQTTLLVDGILKTAQVMTYNLSAGFGIDFWNNSLGCPDVDMFYAEIHLRALSRSEISDFVRYCLRAWKLSRTAGKLITFGDSLTDGFGAGAGEDYGSQLVGILTGAPYSKTTSLIKRGNPGFPLTNTVHPENSLISVMAQEVEHLYGPRQKHAIVMVTAGTNDINQGRTAAQIIADTQTVLSRLRTLGFVVGWNTIPPYQSGLESQVRLDVNAWGRQGVVSPTLAHFMVDLDTTSDGIDLRNPALHFDPTHFNKDGYHGMALKDAPLVATWM